MSTPSLPAHEQSHSQKQAGAQLESILEMVIALQDSAIHGTEEEREEARAAIHEDALSVEVRSGWVDRIDPDNVPEAAEFCILLCTGGPAVRLIGTLDRGEPDSARLEHQDWGAPWTEYAEAREHEEALMAYASTFYFGE